MVFKTSMDPGTRSTTRIVSIAFFLIGYICLFAYRLYDEPMAMLALCTFAAIYLMAVVLSIYQYKIDDVRVEICSYLYKIKLPLENIEAARIIDTSNLLLIRGMGMSGMFGQSGWYLSRELGQVWVYGRKWGGIQVLVQTKANKLYLLSPDDPAAFVGRLENSL